jgi:hypothetical protein
MSAAPYRDMQFYARLAGLLYVVTNLTAVLAFVMRSRVLHLSDPVRSAADIAAAPGLLRLGMAIELVTVAGVLVLVASLYSVLRRFDRNLALIAALWRVAENVVLAVTALNAAALLAAAGVGGAAPAPAIVGLFTKLYGAGYQAGFFFLGLGSLLFSWLWWRSRWVPRALAGLGIFASALLAGGSLALIAAPAYARGLGMAHMMPMGLYELALGLWLLVMGVRIPPIPRAH